MEAWKGNDGSLEGMGDSLGWRPPLCEGQRGLLLRHRTGVKRRAQSQVDL